MGLLKDGILHHCIEHFRVPFSYASDKEDGINNGLLKNGKNGRFHSSKHTC
jgi:hypothetical protein